MAILSKFEMLTYKLQFTQFEHGQNATQDD